MEIRTNWTYEEVEALFNLPLMELVSLAHRIHIQSHSLGKVQTCSLVSIKTGGCPEDCKYCSQSSFYKTDVKPTPLMTVEEVKEAAKKAKKSGAERICLGAVGKEVRDGHQFDRICEMVTICKEEGLEVCCTLGMLREDQATKLKDSGLTAYNHNLDTSRAFYPSIITTRTYQDRLNTIKNVRNAGLKVCTGGILGLGEKREDRIDLLLTLATLSPHPESVPINKLTPIPGTPLGDTPPIPYLEFLQVVAAARVMMPKSMIRLSSGRNTFSDGEQALLFFAGANSIFLGEKLLTTKNAPPSKDQAFFEALGINR